MRCLQQWIIKYLQDEAQTVRTVSSADFLVLGCTSVGIWSNKTKNEGKIMRYFLEENSW